MEESVTIGTMNSWSRVSYINKDAREAEWKMIQPTVKRENEGNILVSLLSKWEQDDDDIRNHLL